MVKTTLRLAALVAISTIVLGSLAGTARAQTEPSEATPTSPPDPGAGDAEAGANPSEGEPTAADGAPPADLDPSGGAAIRDTGADPAEDLEDSSVGIRELPDQGYWFLGLRFRNFIVPKFMVNIFVDGGATVNAFTFGPELTYRRGPLELDIALTYADYSMDPFMFKEKSEPDRAFEKASSDMKLLMASIDIMANIPIDKEGRVSFLVGGDVGVAGVLGNLYRSQAYPSAYDPNNPAVVTADPDRPEQWSECTGPDQPFPVLDNEGRSYCDASNDHYRGYSEASMANGGSKPFIVPYIALPHLALRVKPFKDFQARFDTGFSITGFFIGLGAGYRLPI